MNIERAIESWSRRRFAVSYFPIPTTSHKGRLPLVHTRRVVALHTFCSTDAIHPPTTTYYAASATTVVTCK